MTDFEDKLLSILADQIREDIDEAIIRDILKYSEGRYYRLDWFFRDTVDWKEL